MSSGDAISVRLLSPNEALLLIGLIRRCYSETYIDPSFYEVDRVRERLETGRLHSVGAFTQESQLVGHMGITMREGTAVTADAGMTLVDPAFRGRGIARLVARGLVQHAIAMGLVGVHDYPVTLHAATQRIGAGFGVDMGLMLANMPDDVVFHEMKDAPTGVRSSSLIRWLPFGRTSERAVYLPERYRGQIEALYQEAFLSRAVLEPVPDLAPDASASASIYDERRRILRIAVTDSGRDLASRIEAERSRALDSGALVAHVDLRLGDAATPAAVETLRDLGFFFAGVLPEYRDGDVLRLQWLSESVDVAIAEALSEDSMRAIEAFVMDDRP